MEQKETGVCGEVQKKCQAWRGIERMSCIAVSTMERKPCDGGEVDAALMANTLDDADALHQPIGWSTKFEEQFRIRPRAARRLPIG
jgi:hypothetical protein